LKEVPAHWHNIAKRHFQKNEITQEEEKKFSELLDQKAKDLIKDTNIWHATGPEELVAILKSGRLKSQFETGKSRGVYDPYARASLEQALFAEGSDTKEKRCIYGYLSKDPNGSHEKVDGYGPIRICLKDIEDRTTVIMHDTLCLRDDWSRICAKPVLYKNPNKDMFPIVKLVPTGTGTEVNLIPDDNNPLEYRSVDDMNTDPWSFAEAQIHGGVTKFSIDRIVADGLKPEDLPPELHELLKENNISISYS
jgi:hypothetical protein